MKEELVSIIIPVYNVQDYLSKCVDSVINQTYNNLEIILVDDGSTDNSPKICDDYKKKDLRINVFHKKNGGLSSARNYGIEKSNGKYICFLDSDDFIHSNMIKVMYEIMYENNCEIISCKSESYSNFAEEQKYISLNDIDVKFFDSMEALKHCNEYTFVSACFKIYERSIFNKLRFKENIIHEDAQIAPFIYSSINKMALINAKFYYRYVRDNSIVHSSFTTKNFDIIKISEERIDYYKKMKYDKLLSSAYCFLLGNYVMIYQKAFNSNSDEDIKNNILIEYKKNYKKYSPYLTLKQKIKYYLFYKFPKLTIKVLNQKNGN